MTVYAQSGMPANWTERATISAHNISIYVSKLTAGGDVGVGLAILFVVLLSLSGNGLVLAISYRRRKKLAGSELLCVNLAVVDFLSCVLFYPLSIMSSFNHSWLGCHVTCTYYGLGCFTFGLCGMFTVAAISVTRYLKTCYHLAYVSLESASVRLVCCGSWVVAAVWSSFPLLGWGEYVPEPYGLSCTVAWKRYHISAKDATYVICSFVCFTFIPVLLVIVSQCLILLKVYRFSTALSTRGIHSNLRNAERRLSVMFFCISLGFILAWAPYAIVSLMSIFSGDGGDHNIAPEFFVFPALFAKSSHIYNPFIYFYFNKVFRQELLTVLRSLCSLGRKNRVAVRPLGGPWSQHAIQIQIQLQERKDLSQAVRRPSSYGGGWCPDSLAAVYSCWVSKIRMDSFEVGPGPPREFLPMSA